MPRPRKQPKPDAVILPPELDDDDEEGGSVIPDDDGYITLKQSSGDPGPRESVDPGELAHRPTAKRKRAPRRDS